MARMGVADACEPEDGPKSPPNAEPRRPDQGSACPHHHRGTSRGRAGARCDGAPGTWANANPGSTGPDTIAREPTWRSPMRPGPPISRLIRAADAPDSLQSRIVGTGPYLLSGQKRSSSCRVLPPLNLPNSVGSVSLGASGRPAAKRLRSPSDGEPSKLGFGPRRSRAPARAHPKVREQGAQATTKGSAG
jgi:hypothetical protein